MELVICYFLELMRKRACHKKLHHNANTFSYIFFFRWNKPSQDLHKILL